MAKKPSLVSQELLDAAKTPKSRKGDRKPTDSVQHNIDATDVLGSLKLHKPKKAYGGAVPNRIPIDKEDPEAYFRRLISWSFAVAPLFNRPHRADGGSVEDIEAAIRAAEEVNKRQEASHEKGVSGAVEFAPVGVTEPLSGTRLPLGSLPKETAQVVEPALQAASEIAPYFTPAAPIAAARDVAVGLREGDPTNVALSALGLPGKAAKAAAIGASAFMPKEAEAGPLAKAAKAIKAATKLPQIPLEQAMERVVSPFSQDPDKIRQAIELARDLRIQQEVSGPKSDYYLVGQSRAPKDVTTKIEPIPNLPLKTTNPMTWEDFYNTAKDATFINLGGDRSNFGRLTHINDQVGMAN
jgi:hypothetical protein